MEGKSLRVCKCCKKAIAVSDFVKVSDEELEIISGVKNHEKGVAILHEIGANIVAVTLGKSGTLLSNGKIMKSFQAFR